LPITLYKSMQQLADFEDYSMKGRTYCFMSDALFPFGYGLSYTTFSIGNATINKATIRNEEQAQITIPVSNTGKRNGTEIIQVYVKKVNDSNGPLKTLRAFKRIDVAAGKLNAAIIDLPYNSFEFFDVASGKMKVTPGEYELWYGNSSAEKDLKMTKITIQ